MMSIKTVMKTLSIGALAGLTVFLCLILASSSCQRRKAPVESVRTGFREAGFVCVDVHVQQPAPKNCVLFVDHPVTTPESLNGHWYHGISADDPKDMFVGDRTNAYRSTQDPTDLSFVPKKDDVPTIAALKTGGQSVADALPTLPAEGRSFKLTYYWIALRPKNDPDEVPIYGCGADKPVLTMASVAWKKAAELEGTARYWDEALGESRTINLGAGQCFMSLTYESRWGLGTWNPATGASFQLRPFRSIAIDRKSLVMGRWYYIKELDGARMPYPVSTMTHDGCVRAMDVGGGIRGNHIDFYAAYVSAYQKLINGTNGDTKMKGRTSVTIFEASTSAACKVHIDRGW